MTPTAPANLRGRHELGDILGCAWLLYGKNFSTFLLVALVAAPMQLLATIIVRHIEDATTAQATGIYLQIPVAIIELIAILGIIRGVEDVAQGSMPDTGRLIDAGLQNFWTALTAQLLAGMRILASVVAAPFLWIVWLLDREATIDGRRDWYFATIPLALTAYLVVRWYFIPNVVVIAEKRSWDALDDSADAVRGHWWRTMGIVLLIWLMRVVPVVALASVTIYAHPVVDGIAIATLVSVVLPFGIAAQTLLYYDLKARHSVDDVRPAGIDDPEPDLPREGA